MADSPLQEISDGLWCVHHKDFSVGGLRIGTRSTVVRLRDGSLLLHCPGPLDESAFTAIRSKGDVSHVLTANRMHDLYFGAAAAAFPQAKAVAVAGVRASKPNARVDEVLGEQLPPSLADDFEMQVFDGAPKLDEHVLFHPGSRTLLAVDLAFNIRNATGFTRFAMWINDANDKFCMTRLGKSQYLSDHGACAKSIDRMCDAWDIDRIVISHGEVLGGSGRQILRDAYAFGRSLA